MVIPAGLARLIDEQDGVVLLRQALDHGVSRDAVRHASRPGGQWQRVQRGVYATFTGPLQTRHRVRAALLIAGAEAVVSGGAACQAFGMRYVPDGPLMILIPNDVKRVSLDGVEFRRTRHVPDPRYVRSIPCAPPERAVLDAVRGQGDLQSVRAALCEAVQRGLTSTDRIIRTAADTRRNDPLVRRALDDVVAGCRSAPECECRDLIRTSTILPEPECNAPLPGISGAPLIPDGHWKEARLVYEIDSAEWHRFGEKPEETERRRALLAANGWRVVPISPRRLRDAPAAVLCELEEAYLIGVRQITGAE